jgi:hypothetical protein
MKKAIIAITAAVTLLTGTAVSASELKHGNHGHKTDYTTSHHAEASHNNHGHNNCTHSECANSGYCQYR